MIPVFPAPLLSAEQVAEVLGVTPRVVLDLARGKRLASSPRAAALPIPPSGRARPAA